MPRKAIVAQEFLGPNHQRAEGNLTRKDLQAAERPLGIHQQSGGNSRDMDFREVTMRPFNSSMVLALEGCCVTDESDSTFFLLVLFQSPVVVQIAAVTLDIA